MNASSRQCVITGSNPRENLALVRTDNEEGDVAAALESRVSQSDAGLRRFTDNRDNPATLLAQSGTARK